MRAIWYFSASLIIGGLVGGWAWAKQPEPAPTGNIQDFMRVKLKHSQSILEGLATEDYDKMAKGSQELSLLSLVASWRVLQTEEYVQHSNEFRRAADALRDAAKKKNLDGAALAYVDLTLKCVSCHKYVRSASETK
ncbi:MAG: hypothetical protein SFX18_00440 [Pirellulales bacterium]|nr:hypothetical protein [Pirellulales bacterium]